MTLFVSVIILKSRDSFFHSHCTWTLGSLQSSLIFFRRTKELSQWSVVLGQTYITSSGAVSVETILLNQAYSSVTHDYDIAMVRLASDVLPGGEASITFIYLFVVALLDFITSLLFCLLAPTENNFPFLPAASIHPVCLPPYQLSIMEGDDLFVTGWGVQHENGK